MAARTPANSSAATGPIAAAAAELSGTADAPAAELSGAAAAAAAPAAAEAPAAAAPLPPGCRFAPDVLAVSDRFRFGRPATHVFTH